TLWMDASLDLPEIASVILELESGVRHPIADTLRNYFSELDVPAVTLESVSRLPGKGVSGVDADGCCWKLGSARWVLAPGPTASEELRSIVRQTLQEGRGVLAVSRDDTAVLLLSLGERIRPDADKIVETLGKLGMRVTVLSGDAQAVVEQTARQLAIPLSEAIGERSPEEKFAFVRDASANRHVAMVGDGVNDAAALAAAGVGIGMYGGAEVCLRVADVFLRRPELSLVLDALVGARRTLRVVHTNLAFSLLYNGIGAGAAILGYITPLAAAVLMPLSSLTVVVTSAFATRFGRTA
ncbi:MAG: HAD-IC family P-type ATPase, partial [Bdellovibrionales bacterium]|nr:HAD-IC family P-type ATPase [Bdellovibrionales bacterium]